MYRRLSAVSVVYMWCVLGCVLVREGKQNRQNFTSTYVQSKASCREPGKSSYTLPAEKNFERLPREVQRSDGAQTSTSVSGRASRVGVFSVLAKSARTKRYVDKKNHNYTYTCKAPLRGVGCSPRGDASWHATRKNHQSPSSGSMGAIPNVRNIYL